MIHSIHMSKELSKTTKIIIAGHRGMVGRACLDLLIEKGYNNLIYRTKGEIDLRDSNKVSKFFMDEKPQVVIDSAAVVGGIWANNEYPYKFLMDNMLIQNNLIKASFENKVSKFIFLGSSCIYPKLALQPIREEYLLTDSLEETNQWYSIAKISGVKLCEAIFKKYNKQYICLMPTNLYGINDNFDLKTSHVLPAMIRKIHDAKIQHTSHIEFWGDGTPLREFLNVNDLSKAILFAIENKMNYHLYNIGSGEEISIKELSYLIKKIIGYKGEIRWDTSMPNGTPRKLLDSGRIKKCGWTSKIDLETGIKQTYNWYLNKESN